VSQRGQSITGRRSVSDFIRSNRKEAGIFVLCLGGSSEEQTMTDRGANDGVAATTFDRGDP